MKIKDRPARRLVRFFFTLSAYDRTTKILVGYKDFTDAKLESQRSTMTRIVLTRCIINTKKKYGFKFAE